MSSTTARRHENPTFVEAVALWSLIGVMAGLVGVAWTSTHLATSLVGAPRSPANPVSLVFGLRPGGATTWTTAASVIAGLEVLLLLAVAAAVAAPMVRRARSRHSIDRADHHMRRAPADAPLTERYAARVADRLGVAPRPGLPRGMQLGTTLAGRPLVRSWEDVTLVIAGPRMGKSTSLVIPEILDAPGAVVTTSNKTDVLEVTRDLRLAHGDVWVFDPQQLAPKSLLGPVTWWWDPMSYVTGPRKADQLAATLVNANTKHDARNNGDYFTSAAQNLLANYILAAAIAHRPLNQVYQWLTDQLDDEPASILTEHGEPLRASAVHARISSAPEEKSGVYNTAIEFAAFMTDADAMAWVTPPPPPRAGYQSGGVKQFDPAAFVTSTDTLYSLSKEGEGSCGPLVTALTIAVCEAAEAHAMARGGRLEVPLVVSLDEAANVCRWKDLPDLYSHYGSRGILISTYVQNAAQGTLAWGREGWKKLFSAATVTVYAGGEKDPDFLREMSQLVGDYRAPTVSVSHSKQGRSISTGTERTEPILDVADLSSVTRGRAVVFAAGRPPVIMRTQPWMDGPHAGDVHAAQHARASQHLARGGVPA